MGRRDSFSGHLFGEPRPGEIGALPAGCKPDIYEGKVVYRRADGTLVDPRTMEVIKEPESPALRRLKQEWQKKNPGQPLPDNSYFYPEAAFYNRQQRLREEAVALLQKRWLRHNHGKTLDQAPAQFPREEIEAAEREVGKKHHRARLAQRRN